ncbi:MAG TPA: sulfite exporter TauE/SafE family protein [Pseudomonadales bacterium]|jgi:uncharacterized membrane protein YfcA|nr:sulfite exporter TauE/SafE family protein [Rhodospirillales bacterium]HIL98150.1 sulfite exporter TauE/SafE family protein [Pseudomonadales bacterium]
MEDIFNTVLTTDLVWAMAATFTGGLMLGYTGWGGAMVSIPFLTILYGPVDALVIMMIGAVLITAHLFPAAARQADWKHMTPVLIAMAICVPIGSLLLLSLEPHLIRRIIGWLIVGASLLILSGWRYKGPQGTGASATTGGISGLISGFTGLGGPPLVIYILALNQSAAIQRANILVFMALVSIIILASTFVGGGVTLEAGVLGIMTAPFQLVGGWLGAWLFFKLPAELFKKFSLIALVLLGGFVVFI